MRVQIEFVKIRSSREEADAMVWGLSELFPSLARQENEFRRRPALSEDFLDYDPLQPARHRNRLGNGMTICHVEQ